MGSFSVKAIVFGGITFLLLSEVALYSTVFLTTDINKESESTGSMFFFALFLNDFLVTAIAAFVAAYVAKRFCIQHAMAIGVMAILFSFLVLDWASFGLTNVLSLLIKIVAAYVAGLLCKRLLNMGVEKKEISANDSSREKALYVWECALIGVISKVSFTVYWYFTTRADISGSEFYLFAVIILITESSLSFHDGKIKLFGPTLIGILVAEFVVMIFTIVAPNISPVSYQVASPVLTALIYTALLVPVSVAAGILGRMVRWLLSDKINQVDTERLLPWPFAIGFILAAATPISHPLEKLIKDYVARNNVVEITRSQFEYFNEHPTEGFVCDLTKFMGDDSKQKQDSYGVRYYINYHWGYRYELWCDSEASPNESFFIIAKPYSPSTSSDAVYCADESGAVRMALASQQYSTYQCRKSKTIIRTVADRGRFESSGAATGESQHQSENNDGKNRYPKIKKSEITPDVSASKRGVNYNRFKETSGTLTVHGTGYPALPYGFNYDTSYVISINMAIPYVNVHRENLAKLLVDEFGSKITDEILFQNFGNHRPESLSIIIGSDVPVKILQAVLRVFSQTDIPITITMHTDGEKYRYKAQSVIVGGLLKVQKSPVSGETIDILLREGISQEEFIKIVTELS